MADLRRLADKHSLTILNNRYPGQVLTEYISEATMSPILRDAFRNGVPIFTPQ